MSRTTTTTGHQAGKERPMRTTTLTVDLSKTIGQDSAIQANGGPLFSIRVTCPAQALPAAKDGSSNNIPGFGRVVSAGPVKGYEVLYTLESVVA
jgi:hypothetical protein